MSKDISLENDEEDFFDEQKKQREEWIANGVDEAEAEQLQEDIQNDPNNAVDGVPFDDYTIDERLAKFSKKIKE